MYRRLAILSGIILAAMLGMSWLGYHSVTIWEKGLKGARLGEFAQAAEQVRRDVKRKLDEFMTRERSRPYTDYQYYYIPFNTAPNQQPTLLVSPLKDKLSNGMAYGYFQIEPGGRITTPYFDASTPASAQEDVTEAEARRYVAQLRTDVLPSIKISSRTLSIPVSAQLQTYQKGKGGGELPDAIGYDQAAQVASRVSPTDKKELPIESLLPERNSKQQVLTQTRAFVEGNIASNSMQTEQQDQQTVSQIAQPIASSGQQQAIAQPAPSPAQRPEDLVSITIESFMPLVVSHAGNTNSIFAGQIYLVRHVKIEDRDIVQGFLFDETQLMKEVQDSARIIPADMSFVMSPGPDSDVAYTAALSFGRGELPFGLKDRDPERMASQIASLHRWYLGTIAFMFLAVALGLTSVWRNIHAQVSLARKKDDFISAVSHELRTPLTSIRMHSEMLERNWVKSQEKVSEYYSSMRQESERLSRLIENVLDFSRIQRGRKKYNLTVGDLNKCVSDVIEMMKPYAAQSGFSIQADLGALEPTRFDRDAITQIVVNLLDNAIKYSRNSSDKVVYVRTKPSGNHTLIEVEDRGPGLPHRERKKVFEQFYRVAAESTRETTGTGLGLALVKKFVEAHNGFVEVVSAVPRGAIFRIGLPVCG